MKSMKNNYKCSYENDILLLNSGIFDFRILNIFSFLGTEMSSKPVSYSEFFI